MNDVTFPTHDWYRPNPVAVTSRPPVGPRTVTSNGLPGSRDYLLRLIMIDSDDYDTYIMRILDDLAR